MLKSLIYRRKAWKQATNNCKPENYIGFDAIVLFGIISQYKTELLSQVVEIPNNSSDALPAKYQFKKMSNFKENKIIMNFLNSCIGGDCVEVISNSTIQRISRKFRVAKKKKNKKTPASSSSSTLLGTTTKRSKQK